MEFDHYYIYMMQAQWQFYGVNSLRCDRTWPTLDEMMAGALRHHVITGANVDLSLVRSCGIHMRAISQVLFMIIHVVIR